MSLSIDQMRDLLGLAPEVPAADVVEAYAAWLQGTPAAELLSLEEVKKHLKVELDDEDTLIMGMIAAAIGHLDGEDSCLGRSITRQTRVHRVDDFSARKLRLPYPPVVSVTSVTYSDGAGGQIAVDPTTYEMVGRFLQPKAGQSWPGGAGVEVTYEAGYTTLPPALRAALLLMIGDLYANRETTISGTISTAIPMSMTVENLLSGYRVLS